MADIQTLAIQQCIRAFIRSSGPNGPKPVQELASVSNGNRIVLRNEGGPLAEYVWRNEEYGIRIERISLTEAG